MARGGGALHVCCSLTALLLAAAADATGGRRAAAVFLSEQCSGGGVNGSHIQARAAELLASGGNWTLDNTSLVVDVIPKSATCEESTGGLAPLLQSLVDPRTRAVVGSVDPALCLALARVAALQGKPFVSWTCPQDALSDRGRYPTFVRVGPSLAATAEALLAVGAHFRRKSVAILVAGCGWWTQLAHAVDLVFRREGLAVKHHLLLPGGDLELPGLRPLLAAPSRLIILCLPLRSALGEGVLRAVDALKLAHLPATALLAVHVACPSSARYSPPRGLGEDTRMSLLVLASLDAGGAFDGDPQEQAAWRQVRRGLELLAERDPPAPGFLLLDWAEANGTARWRALARVDAAPRGLSPLLPGLAEWARRKRRLQRGGGDDREPACEAADEADCAHAGLEVYLEGAHIAVIAITSALLAALLILAALIARKQLLKKRMSKGPYKILLTPSDFVFPQVADGLRVDEGIEEMLCCWLQQLQEFGGPEVDKPDLLKGSMGSLRSHALLKSAGSTASLPRNLLVDPRARYNGDLVELKEIPVQGTFELKSKAMDLLVMMHGLRHENLNALIGCLTEPTRPALVYEWCSRGSLEDVLVQDEIKLDWSFRLSLLTDLVRGMKYLHSSPLRVHGNLTSRNCVIDARWVLKVTDYGLPAFHEAQNISPPPKSARELLWTAPELLRDPARRSKGSQPGDVYSFGILMQEVVVRGEPFCMLSLTPEDIIEKVKRPPPLIRPSVSKGAAPPEAINIMRQCWAEQEDMRPDFNSVHDLFKKLNHGRKVNFVDTMFQMLEKYSNNLEELIRERTEQLDMEKKKTEQLLNRMLPSSVAEKLKLGMHVDPEDFREVTIYFSDIVGFTTISAYSTPFEVVDLLNDLYTCFDATINAYTVYKVETIGDAYMVVGGLPVRIPDHADQVATMALDLLHQSGRFKIRHLPYTPLRLRIGLHTGPCCAGVVGLTMPRYCLFGDTVNTASRMESTGSPWRIHISQATKERLDEVGNYQLEYRGETDIKGKGKMPTYWLLGKRDFDKQLPTPPPIGLDERLIRHSRPGGPDGADAAGRVSGGSSFNQGRSEDNSSGECCPSFAVPAPDAAATSPAPRPAPRAKLPGVLEEAKSFDELEPPPQVMATPVSASEVAAALLGVASSSAASTAPSFRRPRRPVSNQDDLSTPYNHYRCLSPSDQNLSRAAASPHAAPASGRLLRRQFSLDRGDEPQQQLGPSASSVSTTALDTGGGGGGARAARLFKQNSAGAAHDLERIEEVPGSPRRLQHSSGGNLYRHRFELPAFSRSSASVSVDSLN